MGYYYELGVMTFLDTEDDGYERVSWGWLRNRYCRAGGTDSAADYRMFLRGYFEARASYRMVEHG